jgi:putative nucleotidyltransferase with HDIG domain
VAQLPLPGRSDPDAVLIDGAAFAITDLPEPARRVLDALATAGHEAVLVGGCVRDLLRGELPGDWDVATAAPPEAVSEILAGSSWENRFGTVTLPGSPAVEITTYRTEAGYADRRRPDEVTFHRSLRDDLARRDFTINAIAWLPDGPGMATGRLADPFDGLGDLRAGRIRAVGDPGERMAEDALRVLRGVRFALRFGFTIDPATEAAIVAAAPTTAGLSAERVRDELLRLVGDPAIRPTDAFARWESLGLLSTLLPELAALRGIPQGKPLAGDALDHSLRTAQALPAIDPILRIAGLLHDIGKAPTHHGGHFIGHELVGARMAEAVLRRLRFGAEQVARVRDAVRHHMFAYEAEWSDAAVRRFIRRVRPQRLGDLFALREADNVASGSGEPAVGGLPELRARIAEQRSAPLATRHLAVDGHDLRRELGIAPGPTLGRILDRLLEAVLDEPELNERHTLLGLARAAMADDGAER